MGIKEMFRNWIEDKKDKAAFRSAVEKETLPLRRAAYLEARRKQALEEGKIIAEAEFKKKTQAQQQTNSDDPFGLKNPMKFMNNQKEEK